jgi:hypothetical protein
MPVRSASLLNKKQQQGLNEYFNNPITEDQTYQAGNQYLQNLLGGGANAFSQFEAPYMQNFQQQILPGIANRFAGQGTGAGAMSSSAFNQTAAQAGSTLQAQLAQLRGGLQMQATGQALQYAQQPYSNLLNGINVHAKENFYQPQQQSGWSSVLGGVAQGLTGAAASYFTGGMSNLIPQGGGGAPSPQGYDTAFRMTGVPGY